MLNKAIVGGATLIKKVKQKQTEKGQAGVQSAINENANTVDNKIKELDKKNKQIATENKEFEKLKEQDF
jgi:dsDNA-specific endonuclease/ATPase MutS2